MRRARRSRARILALAFALSAVFPVASAWGNPPREERRDGPRDESRDVVRLGIFELAPFMMNGKDGSAGGVAADFWREVIGPAMGVDVVVSGPYPIPRLEMMLASGEVDVIPYVTKIPAREAKFLYPSRALMRIAACIVVRRDSPLARVETPSDLFGMKLGFITSAHVPRFVIDERIEIEYVTTTDFRQTNHLKLMAGRVDALLDINYVSFLFDMRRRGYLQDLRVLPIPVDQVPIYSIFGPSPRGSELRSRFEEALSAAPPDSFESITRRYVSE